MKKGLMLLADGFEESEAIVTHDALSRTHQIELIYVASGEKETVISSLGLEVVAKGTLSKTPLAPFDFLILPGGKRGVENLKATPLAMETIRAFHDQGKPIYAICAAPSILGELGYLDGKNYTCFPLFQKGNGHYLDQPVVIDGDLVTGHSMAFTLEFAEAIILQQLGQKGVDAIQAGIRGK